MISWLLQIAALIAASLCGFVPFVFRTFWFSVVLPMCRFFVFLDIHPVLFLHFEVEPSAYLVTPESLVHVCRFCLMGRTLSVAQGRVVMTDMVCILKFMIA